jgi:hypothetical protein
MIVVHIGMKRCGSASIQHFLSANQRPLRRLGVDYTSVGRQWRPSHGNFVAELKGGENFDSSLGSLSGLVEHWRSTPGTLKVISAESFEGLDALEIASLKRHLDGVGEQIRIVMMIRDLAGLLPSLYGHRIRRGQKLFDFDRFFELQMGKKRIDYQDIVRPWADAFGWENLQVRMLDARTLVNGDLLDDFLAVLGMDPDDPSLQSLVRPGVFNASDDWRVVEAIRAPHSRESRLTVGHPLSVFLARADRKFDHGCVERVAIEVGERRGWAGDKGNYLSRPQVQRCAEVHSEAVAALNTRLREPLSAPPPPEAAGSRERDFLPDAQQIPPRELKNFFDEIGENLARRAAVEMAAETRWREAGLILNRPDAQGPAASDEIDFPVVGGKRLVVHIGLKKSGSASIQNFLLANEKVLRGLSIDYTLVGRQARKADKVGAPSLTGHHNFVKEIMGRRKFESRSGTVADLGRYAATTKHEIVIVSSEMFEGCEPRHVATFHEQLGDTGRRPQIVLVIRELMSLLRSSYAQKVRYGIKTHDFDTFYDERIAEVRVDYFATAKAWADVFGWENLSVRLLDRQYLANGDLVDDFLLTAGVKIDDVRIRKTRRLGAVNESSGWKIIEATRALYENKHGLEAEHDLARFAASAQSHFDKKELELAAIEVGDRFGWLGDKGLYLRRDHAQRAFDQFAASIAQLNAWLPDPLPAPPDLAARGFVERQFLPSAEQIPSAELRGFYDQVAEVRREVIAKRRALAKKKTVIRDRVAARRGARHPGGDAVV